MKLRINPYSHIFKTAGAAAGLIFLGVFGFIFGFIGGTLIDQLTAGLRQKYRLRKFLADPGAPRPLSDDSSLCAAAGACVIWYLCRGEAARIDIASAALPIFFPEAPRYCAEALSEHKAISYGAAAEYFGRKADDGQREALRKMVIFCGLGGAASRAAAEKGEAARILADAGYRAEGREESSGAEMDYLILGLEPDASPGEIKRQYHQLAAQFHPDTGTDLSPEQQRITEDAFKRIKAAYERLCGN